MAIKFSVNRSDLHSWMSVVTKTFLFGSQLHDMFRCVRFHVHSGGINFEVSDNTSYLRVANIPFGDLLADVKETVFLVYTDILFNILNSSSKEKVYFECDGPTITIKTESKYNLPTVEDDSYPSHTVPDDTEFIQIDDLKWLSVLEGLVPFVGKDLVRPELAGVSISDNVYVSTEGTHGVIHKRVEETFERMTVFPYFIKVLGSIPELKSVKFAKTDSRICITGKDFFYSCALPSTEFPYGSLVQVLNLLPQYSFKVKITTDALMAALNRVTLLAVDRYIQLKMSFNRDFVTLSCKAQKQGSKSEETVVVEGFQVNEGVEFEPMDLFFSLPLVESLRKLFPSGESLVFSVISDNKPIFVRKKGSGYTFFAVPSREVANE